MPVTLDECVEVVILSLPSDAAFEVNSDEVLGVFEYYNVNSCDELSDLLTSSADAAAVKEWLLEVAPEAFLLQLIETLVRIREETRAAERKKEEETRKKEEAAQAMAEAAALQAAAAAEAEAEAAEAERSKVEREAAEAAEAEARRLEKLEAKEAEKQAKKNRRGSTAAGAPEAATAHGGSLAAKISSRRLQRLDARSAKGRTRVTVDNSGTEAFASGEGGDAATVYKKEALAEAERERALNEERWRADLNRWLSKSRVLSTAVTTDEFHYFAEYCDFAGVPFDDELDAEQCATKILPLARSDPCLALDVTLPRSYPCLARPCPADRILIWPDMQLSLIMPDSYRGLPCSPLLITLRLFHFTLLHLTSHRLV